MSTLAPSQECIGLKSGGVVMRIASRYFRPAEVETLLGAPSKAEARLGARDHGTRDVRRDGGRGPSGGSADEIVARTWAGRASEFGGLMDHSLFQKRVFVAGHRGMVGGAVVRRLVTENCEILTANRDELDLVNQQAVQDWMLAHRPDVVVLAAAKVGGIAANNSYPVDFLYQNLMIEANVIHAAHLADVPRLLFLGSSCIYPRLAPQPIQEDSLLTGPLEPTNEWYAIAKIAGIKLVQAYRKQYGRDWISAMPTNLYGPGDNYDLNTSHVLPALLRKFHEAKQSGAGEVMIWGSGTPLREFMHCDDLADALVFLLNTYSALEHINVGSGTEVSIRELTSIISKVVGYQAALTFDVSKPDGTLRKLMDSGLLRDLGWKSARPLEEGIAQAYATAVAQGVF